MLTWTSQTQDGGPDHCPKPGIGYDILEPIFWPRSLDFLYNSNNTNSTNSNGTGDNNIVTDNVRQLTKIFAVPPVATAISFIAFLMALGSVFRPEPLLSVLAFILALISFGVALAATVVEYLMFSSLKTAFDNLDSPITDPPHISEYALNGYVLKGNYDAGLYTLLAATACLLVGTLFIMVTCCTRDRIKHTSNVTHVHIGK